MNWREREARLLAIFEEYGLTGSQYLGLHAEIEELIEEVRSDAYDDGAYDERAVRY
ncbi:hypothetical protein SCRM01_213 [Synechococcus phage S-CRM01]|uniref:hypothetical protein n=1 Tax=Synechococcus phage S-CRM01 TaxID=1026955 RepID=UPI000209E426|nr:hypothetical protein SCRM01_213 [Synechococcus phage S-CRM01]AEC53159.1 hypothetical protein SCRM01_213 [Synechococcus phage S-CRM01]